MRSMKVEDHNNQEIYQILSAAIAPRPICFASTISKDGLVNLSPYSFFNLVSSNPPICIFSVSRRGRDNTIKHTLENILEVKEVVINIVNYAMVEQVSLASTEYPKGVNEFEKSGFTELPSEIIRPPRVKEAPIQLECIVNDIISLGEQGGAGNLVIAEVKMIHIDPQVLDEFGKIDPFKMDFIARLGGNWYSRIIPESLFEVAKPLTKLGVGVDALPLIIRNSKILTGNDLGKLGNVERIPTEEEIKLFEIQPDIKEILDATLGDHQTRTTQLHLKAAEFLENGQVEQAWKVLMIDVV